MTEQKRRTPPTDVIAVTLPELMARLSCGRRTAETIAIAAGAKIKIGHRALYHIGKIEAYLEKAADQGA